jgi:hypothetical protein
VLIKPNVIGSTEVTFVRSRVCVQMSPGVQYKQEKLGRNKSQMEFYPNLFSVRTSFQETEAKTLLYTIPPRRLLKLEEIETL